MRWLVGHPGPHFSVHDLYEGWVEALRGLGEQVFTFNLGDRLSFYDAVLIEAGRRDSDGRPVMRKAVTREQAIGSPPPASCPPRTSAGPTWSCSSARSSPRRTCST